MQTVQEEKQTLLNLMNPKTMEEVTLPIHEAISEEESQKRRYAYRDSTLVRNSDLLGEKDTTSVWLAKETMEKLIAVCTDNYKYGGVEGVRVHFATYPSDHPDPMLAGKQTIVFQADADNWFGDPVPCPSFC